MILGMKDIMKSINSTWIELQEDKLKFTDLKNFINNEIVYLQESANLNYLRWYGKTIGYGVTHFKNNVQVVVNYLQNRFDNLTYLINNYNYDTNFRKINFGILFMILILFI